MFMREEKVTGRDGKVLLFAIFSTIRSVMIQCMDFWLRESHGVSGATPEFGTPTRMLGIILGILAFAIAGGLLSDSRHQWRDNVYGGEKMKSDSRQAVLC